MFRFNCLHIPKTYINKIALQCLGISIVKIISGDQKVSVRLMITIQVMFKESPASLQSFIDTPNCVLEDRVQYITVHISNVFYDGNLQIINCVGIVIVSCTETFYPPVVKIQGV